MYIKMYFSIICSVRCVSDCCYAFDSMKDQTCVLAIIRIIASSCCTDTNTVHPLGSVYFPERNGTASTELPERPEHVGQLQI